ncbi:glycosyltransferase family 2 protein [Endozoicomonas numazuensis]|uniref:Glucosyl transferase n=1 Tax=Endozoicomonas numazuensis TaxID=1137799 RepID=A0A081NJ73_9GAMM|nr:glycosyltransferase family 2 protein [Endozoicomonas numazuensis]KEQ18496.1 glucosyl transferase [Endozoicomonas numazuensis]
MTSSKVSDVGVSVVIAAWNAADFIQKAIDSALSQENVQVEVIVIDDASEDNTVEVVKAYQDKRVVLIQSENNGGPGAARNLGFAAARGEWIAVLDSDDYFLPGRLAGLLSHADETVDILIDPVVEQHHGDDKHVPFFNQGELPADELTLSHLISTNLIFTNIKSTGYLKPVFRKRFLQENQITYWPEVRIGEDYYFLASCLAHGAKARMAEQSGYVYTIRTDSISRTMNVEDIHVLLANDERFLSQFSLEKESEKAQGLRTRNLIRGRDFLQLVRYIKSRQMLKGLELVFNSPRSAMLLWLPVRKRWLGY